MNKFINLLASEVTPKKWDKAAIVILTVIFIVVVIGVSR